MGAADAVIARARRGFQEGRIPLGGDCHEQVRVAYPANARARASVADALSRWLPCQTGACLTPRLVGAASAANCMAEDPMPGTATPTHKAPDHACVLRLLSAAVSMSTQAEGKGDDDQCRRTEPAPAICAHTLELATPLGAWPPQNREATTTLTLARPGSQTPWPLRQTILPRR